MQGQIFLGLTSRSLVGARSDDRPTTVAEHYDRLDRFYRQIWGGDPVHQVTHRLFGRER